MIKYFSTFSGVAGFESGFIKAQQRYEREHSCCTKESGRGETSRDEKGQCGECIDSSSYGFSCVGYSEIDKYAISVYKKHFPTHKNYGDITKINTDELPDFDILCGGPPCQAFSIAGERRGLEDFRGSLFFDVIRIAQHKRPRIVFFENVKGLLNIEGGKIFKVILDQLEDMGYEVQYLVVNSKFHGVPQNRERVFIIGHLGKEHRPKILPFSEDAEEVCGVPTDKRMEDKSERVMFDVYNKRMRDECPTLTEPNHNSIRVYDRKGFDEKEKGFREYDVCPTLSTMMGTGGNNVPMISSASKREMGFKEVCPAVCARDYKDPKIVYTGGDGRIHSPDDVCQCLEGGTSGGGGTSNRPIIVEDELILRDGRDNRSCLRAGRTTEVGYQGASLRRLTPTECEKLQGFEPDWTKFGIDEKGKEIILSDTQRYKMCGNAVTVNVIADIAYELMKSGYI